MHIGEGGAGHYVKMVHNGIEYGDMQLICEAYAMFQAAGMSTDEMAEVFERWNEGDLQSYLIQITGKILRQRDADSGAAGGRSDPRQGGAEGHRAVDADECRRQRRRRQHHQCGGRGPCVVVDEGGAGCRQRVARRPVAQH